MLLQVADLIFISLAPLAGCARVSSVRERIEPVGIDVGRADLARLQLTIGLEPRLVALELLGADDAALAADAGGFPIAHRRPVLVPVALLQDLLQPRDHLLARRRLCPGN